MANLVAELNDLDLSLYITGPLQAAIQAQQAASMSTVQFIREVGFITPSGTNQPTQLRYVDFNYLRSIPNPAFDPAAPTSSTNSPFINAEVTLKTPFMTLVLVPSIRIEDITIDFNARLTSTETANVTSELGITAELGINYRIVNFKASASYRRTTSRGEKVERTYTLNVHVHAVQDELPRGLDRILNLLEESIVSS